MGSRGACSVSLRVKKPGPCLCGLPVVEYILDLFLAQDGERCRSTKPQISSSSRPGRTRSAHSDIFSVKSSPES